MEDSALALESVCSFSACLPYCAAGGSESGEWTAWGYHAPAVDGKGSGQSASWEEARLAAVDDAADGAAVRVRSGEDGSLTPEDEEAAS